MGSKCPYHIAVRWTRLHSVTKWLLDNRCRLLEYLQEKNPPCRPTPVWWLLLYIVQDYMKAIVISFELLQADKALVGDHARELSRLIDSLAAMSSAEQEESSTRLSNDVVVNEDTIHMGAFSMKADRTLRKIRAINVPAMELEEAIAQADRIPVVRCTSALYLVTLNGVSGT